MFKSVLFFGRKDCIYSNKLKNFLKKNSKKFKYIQSQFINKKLNKNIIGNLSYDYIFCFRSYYILKSDILKKCNKAAINFHPGTPQYRGVGSINYAINDGAKFYGSTAHIINNAIDKGKILNIIKFKLNQSSTVENSLKKTYKVMLRQAIYVIKLLNRSEKNLMKLIKKNRTKKWSKKIRTRKDLNKFYEISININKKNLLKKIRATNTKRFKPFILLHSKKFVLDD